MTDVHTGGQGHQARGHNGHKRRGDRAGPALLGLTLRVDNGTQYTSRDFRSSMAALGIKLEYIYANTPEQNGHIESFHKTLKKEYVWPREFVDLREARQAILGAFDDYNNNQIHASLGYLTPSEFAEAWMRQEAEKDRLESARIIGGDRHA